MERLLADRLTPPAIDDDSHHERRDDHAVVGTTTALQHLVAQGAELLRSGAPVVLCGEPGVGKTHVALSWHHACAPHEPVVELDAAALLQWSDVPGTTGTLIIRHVERLNDNCRQGLLAELKARGAGGRRLIATSLLSARTLAETLVGELGQRLSLFALEVPPLRTREGDIGLLAAHFAAAVSRRFQRASLPIDDDAMALLSTWTYPGNVRELSLAMERAVLWSKGSSLRGHDLPEGMRSPPAPLVTFRIGEMALEGFERKAIEATLQHAQGDKVLAAKLLGMSLRTLYRRLDRQDADDDGPAD
jgi:DNA-binding NtrC family response regulator